MNSVVYLILLLIGGCFGGIMAGLLGVGGGIILTPIQYYLLLSVGVSNQIALPMSFATSLAVIFVTMIRSTKKHLDNDFVVKNHLSYMMILGFLGAIFGAMISTNIDFSNLEKLFGLLCIVAAINMILIKYPDNDDNISDNKIGHIILGLMAGLLCGLLGVGGGIIMVPALTIIFKYPTRKAIGTSSASIIATSLGGVLSYIILGWNIAAMPAYSLGYVNVIQFIFLSITSIIVSGYAAQWSKSIDQRILKAFHIIIVLYIGLKMIGVFNLI